MKVETALELNFLPWFAVYLKRRQQIRRKQVMSMKPGQPRQGFAIVYVLVILAVLFTLSWVVVSVMRQESAQSFRHLEKTIATFAAECGVEHAIYILQFHRNSDFPIIDASGGIGKALEINKKFATSDDFTMELPTNAPDDARFDKLKSVDLNTKLQEIATTYKLEFTPEIEKIEIRYKTLKSVDSTPDRLLKYGKLTISCTAKFGHTSMRAESTRRLEVYRTLSVEPDWQFCVLADSPMQILPGHRKYSAGVISSGNKYIPQYFYVNNGRDATGGSAPAKIWAKNLMIDLNNKPDESLTDMLFLSPLAKQFGNASDTMTTLGSGKYDGAWIDSKHDENLESPLIKYQPYRVLGVTLADDIKGYLVEWDIDEARSNDWIKRVFGSGGSRGAIDLTGVPPDGDFIDKFIGFLGGLFVKPDKFKLNSINGNILRRYGYFVQLKDDAGFWDKVGSWFKKLTGIEFITRLVKNDPPEKKDETNQEKYVFDMGTDEPANPLPYDEEVYKRLAAHGNGRLFDKPEHFSDHKLSAGNLLFWDDIGGKDYNNVVWLWGWAKSYKSQPSDSWWKFWKWGTKNAFEAARRDPSFAIPVNGCWFVDGNVYIEGYYRGRGAVVATGNIIIGGSLMRHPDDGTIDTLAADWITEGANNMLQLIALGTRPAEAGKPTGKIIISPHKYPSSMYQTGIVTSIFSNSQQMKIDANCWAKNGITVETDARNDPDKWKLWGEKDSVITINGNLILERVATDMAKIIYAPFEAWPDNLMVNRFQRWIEILEIMKANDNVVVNLFPQPDDFQIYAEDTP